MTEHGLSSVYEHAISFTGGTMAGVGNVLAGVTMQTSHDSNFKSAYKKLVEGVGIRGLYRGMSSPLIGVTPMFAVSFWSYDLSCRIITTLKHSPSEKSKISMFDYAVAGAISAFPTSLICAPMERVKVLLQTQKSYNDNKEVQDKVQATKGAGGYKLVLREISRGGIRSIYSGLGATLARDVPGSAIYFWAYEYFSTILSPDKQNKSMLSVIISGGIAGVSMWGLVIPVDVIKSRIQAAPLGTYKGMLDCAGRIFSEKGISGFFQGITPAMVRAFISNAAAFVTRDLTIKLMKSMMI